MDTSGISRRDFLVGGAAAAGTLATTEIFGQSVSNASRPVLHIIGYSHIDAAWLWPWRDSSNLAITTARSALDRMNETPGFKFSGSSAIHYRWIQKADPEMFEEIRQRIREGRWEVVGGWPVEPDCNIPSTESFVRHALYGKIYCRGAMGVDVKVGFNPDSFGHAAGLPTILKQSGYNYYVFMRPQEHEQDPDKKLPLLFWWEGPDGSRVLTLRILNSYDNPAARIPMVADTSFAPGFSDGAFFLGVGDHGGAVTKAQIQEVLQLRNETSLPDLRWSTTREFFSAVESSPAMQKLPVIKGELQHHSRGCYSACGKEKYQNRRSERALVEAESIALLSSLSLGRKYPKPEFESAWWNVLFNQFHDLMAGTALYTDYQEARDGLGAACQTAQVAKIEALEALAKQVDMSQAEAGAVFVFNPLPWHRKALLEYRPGGGKVTYLKARDGSSIPIQMRPSTRVNFEPRLSAWIDLPPFGYRVFTEEYGTPPPAPPYGSSVSISANGFGISSLKAPDGAELLASQLGLVVIADSSDTWGHGIDNFQDEIGRPTLLSSTMAEDGPVTRITRQILRWQQSEIAVEIATFAALDIVRLHFVINWNAHGQILKLEIPTALTDPKVFAMVPGTILERNTSGNEEPYQDWVALQGRVAGNTYTLGLLNNSTYSYDCLNGVLRTILIRSAPYTGFTPTQVPANSTEAWQDQGRQERVFWLVAKPGKCTDLDFDRLANGLQMPAEYVMDSRHRGNASWEDSFFEITPDTVSVLAMKQAEDASDAVIVRIQERSGKHSTAHLESSLLRLSSDVPLSPWELKTLRIVTSKHAKAKVSVVSTLEI
ncbi:MAG: glycoside hydrolase family 38 N-terminal domain-containing protein [Acidobacteriaceae bacterium]